MSIQIRIPRILQKYSAGKSEFEVDADTIGELLLDIKNQQPSLYVCVCDETGNVRRHINLFLNEELLICPAAFKKRIESGDVVSVFQSVSGG